MVSKIIQNMSVSQTFQSLQFDDDLIFRTNFEPEIDTSEHFRQHIQNARGFVGIVGLSDQWTAILQSQDFNLLVF